MQSSLNHEDDKLVKAVKDNARHEAHKAVREGVKEGKEEAAHEEKEKA